MKASILLLLSTLWLSSCKDNIEIESGNIVFSINENMGTKVNPVDKKIPELMNGYTCSEYLKTKVMDLKTFKISSSSKTDIKDIVGSGKKTIVEGTFDENGYQIKKILELTVYDSFPGTVITKVKYINTGKKTLDVIHWVNNSYKISANNDTPAFWSFQGSSSGNREDWIQPVDSTFSKRNFMGMVNTDYGGGIPIVDLWRRDIGIAIGHLELTPKLVSLPVEKDAYENAANISIVYEYKENESFKPGDTISTINTFISLHNGDCYSSLSNYSKLLQAKGIKFVPEEPEAFEAVWCAWGYERKFTLAEVEGTLPKVKELGLKWVDIDDGYQAAEGDWNVPSGRFPNGSKDMRRLVDKIHAMGLKAKIWWAPLAVDPGSKLFEENPDIILHTYDGAPQYITWWDSYYMSPVYSKTWDHTKSVLKLFLQDWDYNGLKMDGQHLNCAPPDYNRAHHLSSPEESFEQLPQFFKMIYDVAREYKPHAVIQNCPCGCAVSFFNVPYMNQAVASDPTSGWQIRLKGKVYKALRPGLAYYGDHIEKTEGGSDFATQIGTGAVLGTKFTWPKDNPYAKEGTFVLTPEREKIWKKWIDIYNTKMLSKGDYEGNLYDIGYDKPEAHVIKKSDTLYYAFYASEWNGNIQLKGLTKDNYRINDYENEKSLGTISKANPLKHFTFKKHLLLELIPIK